MARQPAITRHPARRSRWAASGLTAAVTVSIVGAMTTNAEHDHEAADDIGSATGAVARDEAELAVVSLMAAADPGDDGIASAVPPRIAQANVS
jgi:hypothetical protein